MRELCASLHVPRSQCACMDREAGARGPEADADMCLQVQTARHQWMAEEDGGVDDCTAIVCFLTQGSAAPGSLPPTPLAAPSQAAAKAGALNRPSISRQATPHVTISLGYRTIKEQSQLQMTHVTFRCSGAPW